METIELQLGARTLDRVQYIAASRRCTLEELIKESISQLGTAQAASDPCRDMLAPEPKLIAQVTESAMQAREQHPLR